MPKVSVVIPVYNSINTLRACYESIEMQSFKDMEIIFVDNNSTDNCMEKCREWQKTDERIKIVSCKRQGVSAARNTGIDCALGEYLFFIDSDDKIAPNLIQMLVKCMEDYSCEMAFSNVCHVYYSKSGKDKSSYAYPIDDMLLSGKNEISNAFAKYLDSYIFYYVFKMFKISVIRENNIRFDEECSLGEDIKFNVRYLDYCDNIYILGNPMYFYKKNHGEGLNSKYRENMFQLRYNAFRQAEGFLERSDVNMKDYTKQLYTVYLNDVYSGVLNIFKNPVYEKKQAKKEFSNILNGLKTKEMLDSGFGKGIPISKRAFLYTLQHNLFAAAHAGCKFNEYFRKA